MPQFFDFDDGLRSFVHASFPGYDSPFADYLQYAPIALVPTLKLCGLESRSRWGSMATSAVFSTVVEVASVRSAKAVVARRRPTGFDNTSFPSGHTATSFMGATLLQKEYGWKYPWIGFAGYATATVTGLSRIACDWHYGTDVIAGAVFGVLSCELGYWLSDLIWKDKSWTSFEVSDIFSSRLPYEIGIYYGSAVTGPVNLAMTGIEAAIPVLASHGQVTNSLELLARIGISGSGHCNPSCPEYGRYTEDGPVTGWDAFHQGGFDLMLGLGYACLLWDRFLVRPHAFAGAAVVPYSNVSDRGLQDALNFQSVLGADLGFRTSDHYMLHFDIDWLYRNTSGSQSSGVTPLSALMLGGGASFCF